LKGGANKLKKNGSGKTRNFLGKWESKGKQKGPTEMKSGLVLDVSCPRGGDEKRPVG